MISTSLPLLMAMLALPAGGSDPMPQGSPATGGKPASQEETIPGAEGVRIGVVLIDLAASLDPGKTAPASPAAAMTRLQAAGMVLPAGLDPDQPLRKRDAVGLTEAVGLKVTAGRPVDAVFPAELANALVHLLHEALVGTREPGE